MKNLQAEIKRLQELCAKNKIDITPPQAVAVKQPNRAERRRVSKQQKK